MNDQDSGIAWTDQTWNPVHGCSKVSPGCRNCYAERISRRYDHTDHPWTAEHAAANVTERPDRLDAPRRLDAGRRIFVNSMSDLFHPEVSPTFVREVLAVCANHPRHVFQILTKRPARARDLAVDWPPNVWLGVSVEDDRVAGRIDTLRQIDAALRFVSFEPLIGPVDDPDLSGIDWVIVGGESGPDDARRPMAHEWVWPIRDAAEAADAAFFFKQSSAPRPEQGQALRCRDGVRRRIQEVPDLPAVTQRARRAREDEPEVSAG